MLTFDVMEDILLRSHAKDLVPWKRVCKSWYSLIASDRFAKAHLKITGSGNHARIAMPMYWKIPNQRLYQSNRWKVVGSCNGLVCIFNTGGDPVIAVINPYTTELRILPMAPRVSEKMGVAGLCVSFAYDSSTDDYKVVLGIRISNQVSLVQVLSLKSNTWKFIGQFSYIFAHDTPAILFNEKLHWLVFDYHNTSQKQDIILSFDLSLEEFQVIPQPNDSEYRYVSVRRFLMLGTVDDQFCVYFIPPILRNHPPSIWAMRSYGVERSWELLPDNYEMKHKVVHHLEMLEYGSPMNKSATFFCDDNKCLSWETRYIHAHRFVPSLVSPNAGRPTHANNNNTSFQPWIFTETIRVEEIYRREVGESENVVQKWRD